MGSLTNAQETVAFREAIDAFWKAYAKSLASAGISATDIVGTRHEHCSVATLEDPSGSLAGGVKISVSISFDEVFTADEIKILQLLQGAPAG
jgi:hypothetical protein